jgi:hypothetical protein
MYRELKNLTPQNSMTQWRNGQMSWTELFKGRRPNGQKTHEDMLYIPDYKGNAN